MSRLNRTTKERNAFLESTVVNNSGESVKTKRIVTAILFEHTVGQICNISALSTRSIAKLLHMNHTKLIRKLRRHGVAMTKTQSKRHEGQHKACFLVDLDSLIPFLCIGNMDYSSRLYARYVEARANSARHVH